MRTHAAHGPVSAAEEARAKEDVVVGDEVVRHRLSSRVIHWVSAASFMLLLVTGMPIWSPIFGWMAALVGGLQVCRWLHPWAGVVFAATSLVMFARWLGEMRLEKHERAWLGPKMIEYFRFRGTDPEVGKYNGGQKIFFFLVSLASLVLLATGFVLWFPLEFGRPWGEVSLLLHDAAFIFFTVAIVFHVYLGTAAEPGTFRAMTRGTVTRAWARHHHPRWYRDVTRDERRR